MRDYWTHQWQTINPRVEPTAMHQRPDGRLAVSVHQLVRDLQGEVMFDGSVTHVYSFQDGLIMQMDIEPAA